MTIDEMNAKRTEYGLTYRMIAETAGMPISTVQKILGGLTKAPRKESLRKIQEAICAEQSAAAYNSTPDPFPVAAEQAVKYGSDPSAPKKQGQFTLEDYYAVPDEYRSELIDGVFYDMTAPCLPHQMIAGEIHAQLMAHVKSRKGLCLPMISPVDVQLDCDNRTMLQPDVLIVCDRSRLIRRCVYGAPDLIVEVLSPSTRKKDMSVKMQKYISAGVREYWLVDPDRQMVIVYDTEHLALPRLYSFQDPIPVGIWNGECLIDLSETGELLNQLFAEEDGEMPAL